MSPPAANRVKIAVARDATFSEWCLLPLSFVEEGRESLLAPIRSVEPPQAIRLETRSRIEGEEDALVAFRAPCSARAACTAVLLNASLTAELIADIMLSFWATLLEVNPPFPPFGFLFFLVVDLALEDIWFGWTSVRAEPAEAAAEGL